MSLQAVFLASPIMIALCAAGTFAASHSSPQWSQDGSSMVAASDSVIYLFDANGSQTKSWPLESPISVMALSPNGNHLAFINTSGQLWITNLGDGTRVKISSPTSSTQLIGTPQWSPTGANLSYTVTDMQVDAALAKIARKTIKLYLVNPDGSGNRMLTAYNPTR